MALGANDVQAAEVADELSIVFDLGFDLVLNGLNNLVAGLAGLIALLAERVLDETSWIAAKQDVDAAPGHIRRDGHGSRPASLCDDAGLTLVLLCIQHLVGNALALEH